MNITQLEIPGLKIDNSEKVIAPKLLKSDLSNDLVLKHISKYNVSDNAPIFVSYGGGTNSTAMLIAMYLKGIKPEAIFFADTGGELPETYEFIDTFSKWLTERGFPEITIVRYTQKNLKPRTMLISKKINPIFKSFDFGYWDLILTIFQNFRQFIRYSTLEEECLILNALPSRAFGIGSCSTKWKITETQKTALSVYKTNKYSGYVKIFIGYHYDERERLLTKSGEFREILNKKILVSDFPLIRWGLNQANCQALLDWAGLKVGKSACFFCPNAKPYEVLALREKHPDLYQRACDIEANFPAKGSVIGLGRSWKWSEIDSLPEFKKNSLDFINRKCSCTDE